ncbi:TetR/AcrR family transcriptional regulator [Trinickia caryophylli]|uniref:Transcriptional regulator, TetR family n=1 Tax=Trinickia caryophylli TaxID=28094 RepID=A0A1X7H7E8_TRICW|nr:TetR/AcrR family transcriptional regulator [Trinickia caryophylli]PMS09450.1 TetR/AcrR family transcriptional regulator [Trinickia caryophylli]TRX14120.1 helix-turn-helix transcriptional regulator [Trinickia caryophylli]WQE13939.1 TetR/AcrR family transcriptional regulator [Trinickia caryophylli]SMF81086.1 transcriptional regulator, TetR family [Trinickia caryophylli]GLU35716.1 TetR family transcriptional regulator [Trinickia caryophylli]
MDNPTRSAQSRNAAIQAALAILTKDGPAALTFDALSRESGISKGGLLHQFRNKTAILKALLAHQQEYFESFANSFLSTKGSALPEPTLSCQIAVTRESINQPNSVARAILAALVEDPNLLSEISSQDSANTRKIRSEAKDPDIALLRLFAARGLAYTTLLGLNPLSERQRERLFKVLLDDDRWSSHTSSDTDRER